MVDTPAPGQPPLGGAAAADDPRAALVVLLGDGRRIAVGPGSPASTGDLAVLAEGVRDDASATPAREALLSDIGARLAAGDHDPGRQVLLVARDEDGHAIAVGGYRSLSPGRATAVCEVDAAYQRLGLGTFLLRRLAAIGLAHGIGRFRVDVASDAAALAGVLRDCGLRTHWNLGRVTHVDLDLRGRRPGWATPECRIAAAASRR